MYHSPQTLKTIAMSWCTHTGTQSVFLMTLKLHMLKIWMENMLNGNGNKKKKVTLTWGGILSDWKKTYFAKPQWKQFFFFRKYRSHDMFISRKWLPWAWCSRRHKRTAESRDRQSQLDHEAEPGSTSGVGKVYGKSRLQMRQMDLETLRIASDLVCM